MLSTWVCTGTLHGDNIAQQTRTPINMHNAAAAPAVGTACPYATAAQVWLPLPAQMHAGKPASICTLTSTRASWLRPFKSAQDTFSGCAGGTLLRTPRVGDPPAMSTRKKTQSHDTYTCTCMQRVTLSIQPKTPCNGATFKVQDVPAHTHTCHEHDAKVMLNTIDLFHS